MIGRPAACLAGRKGLGRGLECWVTCDSGSCRRPSSSSACFDLPASCVVGRGQRAARRRTGRSLHASVAWGASKSDGMCIGTAWPLHAYYFCRDQRHVLHNLTTELPLPPPRLNSSSSSRRRSWRVWRGGGAAQQQTNNVIRMIFFCSSRGDEIKPRSVVRARPVLTGGMMWLTEHMPSCCDRAGSGGSHHLTSR